MAAKLFPASLFRAARFQLYPVGTLIGGGAALAGPGQTVDWSTGGWWMGEFSDIRLSKPDEHRAWRALMMHAAKGGEIVMPVLDGPQRPMLGAGGVPVGFQGDVPFSDGQRFAARSLAFELAEPALEGDTEVLIRRVNGAPLRGGEYWSVSHLDAGWRVHCIEEMDDESGGVRAVRFGVPLRGDLASGAPLDFEEPRVTMRLASDPKEVWPTVRPPFRADVSIRFVESFDHL